MKKVLALVLASAMAIGMAATVFGATVDKATGFAKDVDGNIVADLEDGYTDDRPLGLSGNYSTTSVARSVNNQTVSYTDDIVPHDEVEDYIYLTTAMFDWDSTHTNNNTGILSAKQIRTSKLAVRTSVSSGSKAIDEVKIENKDGRILIAYAPEWVSTKDLDFDFTVYLTFDGKRWNDQGLTFVGTLANEITEVYSEDDYVDTSSGQIAEAMDFVKDIEVDLGNGVSIFTKMFKSKKYYGTCTRDADEQDDVVFAKYADIDNVVTMKTVGLNSTGDIVQLDTDYSDYYVYDKDLNYLGQSNELLPYSTKYYLANKKLDITDGDDDDGLVDDGAPVTDDDDDGLNPASGGDDGADNANANPSTGR